MTEPSDPWRLEALEGTLRGSLPNARSIVGSPKVPEFGEERGSQQGDALPRLTFELSD